MSELFLFIYYLIKNYINEVALLLISIVLTTILFIVWIFILRLSSNFVFIKKLNFLLIELSFFILQISINIIANKSIGYSMLYLSVALVYLIFIFSVKQRKAKTKKEHKSFIKYIDDEIKRTSFLDEEKPLPNACLNNMLEEENTSLNNTATVSSKKNSEDSEKKKTDIDFTHVKNVLSRLEYYPLSSMDKKQVKELENAILLAEGGDNSRANKIKINDCLGALLKIMSKYGV